MERKIINKIKKVNSKLTAFCFFSFSVCIIILLSACGKNQMESNESDYNSDNIKNLLGTWVSPDADNQTLKIDNSEVTFNYRTFSYTVNGDELELYQTYPYHRGIEGSMPYELNGDKLTIKLGTAFEGYFYGRSGTVNLVRK